MALIEKNMNKAVLSLNLINTDVFVLRTISINDLFQWSCIGKLKLGLLGSMSDK